MNQTREERFLKGQRDMGTVKNTDVAYECDHCHWRTVVFGEDMAWSRKNQYRCVKCDEGKMVAVEKTPSAQNAFVQNSEIHFKTVEMADRAYGLLSGPIDQIGNVILIHPKFKQDALIELRDDGFEAGVDFTMQNAEREHPAQILVGDKVSDTFGNTGKVKSIDEDGITVTWKLGFETYYTWDDMDRKLRFRNGVRGKERLERGAQMMGVQNGYAGSSDAKRYVDAARLSMTAAIRELEKAAGETGSSSERSWYYTTADQVKAAMDRLQGY